jgi:hypothetical protein
MNQKKRINFKGKEVEVTVLSFQVGGEHWNEYLVDDGTVIRMKTVATEINRIDQEYDEEGNPVYLVKSTNVVNVSAPEKLRGPRSGGQ